MVAICPNQYTSKKGKCYNYTYYVIYILPNLKIMYLLKNEFYYMDRPTE